MSRPLTFNLYFVISTVHLVVFIPVTVIIIYSAFQLQICVINSVQFSSVLVFWCVLISLPLAAMALGHLANM